MSEWHYLSFAAERFLGACIVRGDDAVDAVKEAHRLGCNPGGEVLGVPVPDHLMPKAGYTNRLLSRSEVDECWDDCRRLGEILDEGSIEIPDGNVICQHQNAADQTGGVPDAG